MNRINLSDAQAQTFDIIVIGGGVTGANAARDAALRNLSVLLLEKEDFAAGTSSRSTKLLHGGLRYLQSYEFKLVREACRERELMLKLAPHLAHVRPFIYVLYRGYPESMFLLNVGLTIYDFFSGAPLKRRHHMLNARRLLEIEPDLNPEGLLGGGYYYDFLTDDARFTIEAVKGAAEAGAQVANYAEVTGFVYEGDRITGVEAHDLLTGESAALNARQVINCAGVWVDRVRFLEPAAKDRLLRPTKGIHIAVRKSDFPLNHAVFLRSPRDNRVVWPIPAIDEDLVYIGTTDTDYQGSLDHVVATEADVEYLLEVANFTLPASKLGYEHIVSTWAGLRPLIKPEGELAASAVSREHKIFTSPGGLLNIAGGKMTTARVMGKQVVDAAARRLGAEHNLHTIPPSVSAEIPLSGGDSAQTELARRRLDQAPLEAAVRARWLAVYGANALNLLAYAEADPASASPLDGGALTLAEVRYAVEHEMARTLSDFFTRRTGLFYWSADGGLAWAAPVAAEMGRLLGWSAAVQAAEVATYTEWVTANRFEPDAAAAAHE